MKKENLSGKMWAQVLMIAACVYRIVYPLEEGRPVWCDLYLRVSADVALRCKLAVSAANEH